MIIYERKYPVNVFDTDIRGRLSPGSLFNYFQDLAGRHASLLGFGREHLITNGFFWVLSRMVVKIERMPRTWEEVTIRTWPRGTDAIFALRDLEMFDAGGNRIVGASSSWVIVDLETRKVQRPDRALSFLNAQYPGQRALEVNAGKVPALQSNSNKLTRLTAQLDDMDINDHVNNARYIHWVTNSYDMEFIGAHIPETVEVNYLSEGHQGDAINILTSGADEEGNSFIHSVIREADHAELCRLRIKWKEERL
ncbi:MAG: thioesterase [Bacteroidales bacterium]|jgi:acyl-ACP thioesterase|nr:thioesterase [Bacteroidales bacterium]